MSNLIIVSTLLINAPLRPAEPEELRSSAEVQATPTTEAHVQESQDLDTVTRPGTDGTIEVKSAEKRPGEPSG